MRFKYNDGPVIDLEDNMSVFMFCDDTFTLNDVEHTVIRTGYYRVKLYIKEPGLIFDEVETLKCSPTLGRIVLYTDQSGSQHPAMIVMVTNGNFHAGLCVFFPDHQEFMPPVCYSHNCSNGTWSWSKRD